MKYFNKSFFKFTLGFLVIVSISLLIIAATSAYAAGVEKIAFTTDEQNIKPNELSSSITIQTQDSSSNSIQTPETIDLEFVSTSPTGEFLGSTGNPATKTMSKNTSNRTFYYRDSASGSFTISVKAMGRDSREIWNANQKITVSSGGESNDSSGEVLGTDTGSSSSVSSQSATSGAVAPLYATLSSQLEISAGADRLTSPGSPISLQAFIKKNSTSNQSLDFSWSFGDGNTGQGGLVTHMYKYPGEYAVVLNAKAGNTFAVSRLKVRVAVSDVVLSLGDGYIEITNNSNYEINLFNWKIVSSGKGFVFQPDTIVLPKSNIRIDLSLLTMKGQVEGETMLTNFLGKKVVSIPDPITVEDLNNINAQVSDISKQAMNILDQAISAKLVLERMPKVPESFSEPKEILPEVVITEPSVAIVYEAPKSVGILTKLTDFIKRVFSD